MKNQLLEDFGDSASQPVPAGRSAPPPAPAPPPPHTPAASAVPPKVWRERVAPPRPVWRARDAAAPEPPSAPPPPSPPPPPPPPRRPLSEPLPPMFADDRFSISSQQPDLAIGFPDTAPTWTERWGRKLFGWTAGLAVVGAAVGAGLWMYQDTQVVSTLALVADESPPPAVRWSEADREIPAAPPLVLLPAEAAAPAAKPVEAPASASEPAASSVEGPAPAAEPPVVEDNGEEAARAAAESVRRAEARRLAARKEAARKEAIKKETARKEAAREVARNEAARKEAARVAASKASDPAAQQAETLRQCRAAGYHASQCLRRGCVATKYGLACRG